MGGCKSKPKLRRSHERTHDRILEEDGGEMDLLGSNEDTSVKHRLKNAAANNARSVSQHAGRYFLHRGPEQHSQISLPPETMKTLRELEVKDDFTENRWDCIWRPERAVHTLGPYAQLSLEIEEGRSILTKLHQFQAHGVKHTGAAAMGLMDMFVRVFVDDIQVLDTVGAPRSSSPAWNYNCNIDITCPRSMIRLQIFDRFQGMDELDPQITGTAPTPTSSVGFVEFCVGDLPFNDDIECWLELRFPSLLQGDNLTRYEQHCSKTDHERHLELHMEGKDQSVIDLFGTARVKFKKSKGKASLKDLMTNIVGKGHASDDLMDFQFNAGALKVKMVLSLSTSSRLDQYFALSLEAPAAVYDYIIQQDHMPDLDLQGVVDDTIDVKLAVFDDFIIAFFLYVWYILLWKHAAISLVSTLAMTCYLTEFPNVEWAYIACFSLQLFLLLVNANENQRLKMTIGGVNAPLNEEGFKRVAHWDSSDQMHAFIMRCVQNLGGTVRSEHDLRPFVVRVVKERKTAKTLKSVLEAMRHKKWCRLPSQLDSIKNKRLVRLHGRRKGIVKRIGQADLHSSNETNSANDTNTSNVTDMSNDTNAEVDVESQIQNVTGKALVQFEDMGVESCSSWTPAPGDRVFCFNNLSEGHFHMTKERVVETEKGSSWAWAASVKEVADGDTFFLCDDQGNASPHPLNRSQFFFAEEERSIWVPMDNLEGRMSVPLLSRRTVSVATSGLGLKLLISAWSFRIEKIRDFLVPLLRAISDVLTWRKPRWTFLLLLWFAFRLTLSVCHLNFPEQRKYMKFIEDVLRLGFGNMLFVAFALLLCQNSTRLGWLRAVARIVNKSRLQRSAPEGWAFASNVARSSTPTPTRSR